MTPDQTVWAAIVAAGVAVTSLGFQITYLVCDADGLESGAYDPLLIVIGPLWAPVRRLLASSREAFRDAAALLVLLLTSPKGAQL